MNPHYQSLAYFMRRPTGFTAAELIPFYRDVIGLPVVRDHNPAILFWAGEDLIFEIKCDDHPEASESEPDTSTCLPVFRSHDLPGLRARLSDSGYPPVIQDDDVFFAILGPDRLLIGFEARPKDSDRAADREALRRWQNRRTSLKGISQLPDDLHYLSRIVRHVADVPTVSSFYEHALGLDVIVREDGSVLHSLGDTTVLELAPGGPHAEPPESRTVLPNSFIVRIHEFEDYVAHLRIHGAQFSGEFIHYHTGTKLAYVADPDGNLVGIEDRTLWGDYVEDLEADRRWRARAGETSRAARPRR